jgi:uncharacterized protein YneF (UPF0154 family)
MVLISIVASIVAIVTIVALLFIGFYFGWNAAKKEFQNQGREW